MDELNPRYLLARAGLLVRASTGPGDPGLVVAYSAENDKAFQPLELSVSSPFLGGDDWRVGTTVAVVVQKDSGTLHGYSAFHSGWHSVAGTGAGTAPVCAAVGNVATVQQGDTVLVFGAESGRWCALPGGVAAPCVQASANLVLVTSAGTRAVYALSGIVATTTWASPQLAGTGALVVEAPGANVALVGEIGGTAWAYSATSHAWVPFASGSSQPRLETGDTLRAYGQVAVVLQPRQGLMHAFSANTGLWYRTQVTTSFMDPAGAGNVAVVRTEKGAHAFTGGAKPAWCPPTAGSSLRMGVTA